MDFHFNSSSRTSPFLTPFCQTVRQVKDLFEFIEYIWPYPLHTTQARQAVSQSVRFIRLTYTFDNILICKLFASHSASSSLNTSPSPSSTSYHCRVCSFQFEHYVSLRKPFLCRINSSNRIFNKRRRVDRKAPFTHSLSFQPMIE